MPTGWLLQEIARLFAYFRDKDEFAEYARRSLCKRLLARGPAFNESAEKHFIFLLKEQCGNPFTRRLQVPDYSFQPNYYFGVNSQDFITVTRVCLLTQRTSLQPA